MGKAGNALRQVLINYEIKRSQLAKTMGINAGVVSRWVSEDRDPLAEALFETYRALQTLKPEAAEEFIRLFLKDAEVDEGWDRRDQIFERISENTLSRNRRLFEKILAGSKNIQFSELVSVIEAFGFALSRVSGSHHIFTHPDISETINIQNKKGKAIPYQVHQFIILSEEYALTPNEDTGEDEP